MADSKKTTSKPLSGTAAAADLAHALQRLKEVVEIRLTLPILSCVRLELVKDRCLVAATDLEGYLRMHVAATVETPGVAVVNAGRLADVAKSLAGVPVTLAGKPGFDGLTVRANGGTRVWLPGMPPDEYPPEQPPAEKAGAKVLCLAAPLATAIQQTLYATSTDVSRPFLGGLHVSCPGGALRLEATDGHRLARADCPIEEQTGATPTAGLIVPTKACKVIRDLARDAGDGKVTLVLGESTVHASGPAAAYYSKVVEGNFPQTEQVLPKKGPKTRTVALAVESLAVAVQRAALVLEKHSRGGAVILAFSEKELDITASSVDAGEAQTKVPIAWPHEPLHIGFNPRYLVEYLGSLDDIDTVELHLTDPLSPGLFTTKGGPLYVLMPVRV